MERRIKGLALILFGIFLGVCFPTKNFSYFDLAFLEIPFSLVYLLIGDAGLGLVFWPQPPKE